MTLKEKNQQLRELSRTVDYQLGEVIAALLPTVKNIHSQLRRRKHTERRPLKYEDTDYKAFFLPSERQRVFAIEAQTNSSRYLYILDESSPTLENFHIRKYFKTLSPEERQEKLREATVQDAMVCATRLEEYSDHFPGNLYVTKPDLAWFKHKDFSLRAREEDRQTAYMSYGDVRDPSYVLTFQQFTGTSPMLSYVINDGGMRTYPLIQNALFELEMLEQALKEK